MRRLILIAGYFLKKNFKDIISFSIILFIATALFASAFTLQNNISSSYDAEFQRLNTADSFFTIPSAEYSDTLLENIAHLDGVENVQKESGIMLTIPVQMDDSSQEQIQIFYNLDQNPDLNRRELANVVDLDTDKGIYLAHYTFLHSGLNPYDQYRVQADDTEYIFDVKGSVREMQYGNYTSSVIGEYLEPRAYQSLLADHHDAVVVTISATGNNDHAIYDTISKYLSSQNIHILSKNYATQVKSQRLAISNVLILILVVFSSVILIVSLCVSKFKIENGIAEEIANMGVLKALGYTSREIIIACILPYLVSGFIFALLGIVGSYELLPILSLVVEMQSGFHWEVSVDLSSNLVVLLIILALILAFTLTAALKIRRLNPILAIRSLFTEKHTRNAFPIDRTQGSIDLILALKNFASAQKQNLLLGIVLFFITIVASFIGTLFYNINLHPLNFVNTLVEEYPSVVITARSDLRNELNALDNVKNAIYYDETLVTNYQDNSYKTFVAESFSELNNDLCYEGRNPERDNEVALGSALQAAHQLQIGDQVTLSSAGVEAEYEIVGFVQSVNYSGEIIETTLEGYRRLDSAYQPQTIYVYLEDVDAEQFITEVETAYPDDVVSTLNYTASMASAMSMYTSLIGVICLVVIVITLLLIYLILYIIISSLITQRRQELGILKSLGYQNRQLVYQLVGGFMPSAVIATILGFIASKAVMSRIYLGIFRSIGAYKVGFDYPLLIFLLVAICLVLSVWLIGILLARKIKNISVYSLIKE